jgi:hypothetical protein
VVARHGAGLQAEAAPHWFLGHVEFVGCSDLVAELFGALVFVHGFAFAVDHSLAPLSMVFLHYTKDGDEPLGVCRRPR